MSAINELLEDLDPTPTHIIVWSQRCFNLLPSGVEEDEEFVVEEYKTRVRRYCIKGKIIKAINGVNIRNAKDMYMNRYLIGETYTITYLNLDGTEVA
jgi:hypothetical protein